MNHSKSQALHTDLQLPITRESRPVPTPCRVGLFPTPRVVQGTTHLVVRTPPRARHNTSCPVLSPATGASSWASHHAPAWWTLWEWWAVWHNSTSIWNICPQLILAGKEGSASRAQTGSVGKCANSERMSSSAPGAWCQLLLTSFASGELIHVFHRHEVWSMKDAIVPWRSPQDAASILFGPGFASLPIVLNHNFATQYCQFLRRSGRGHSLTDPFFPSPESS